MATLKPCKIFLTRPSSNMGEFDKDSELKKIQYGQIAYSCGRGGQENDLPQIFIGTESNTATSSPYNGKYARFSADSLYEFDSDSREIDLINNKIITDIVDPQDGSEQSFSLSSAGGTFYVKSKPWDEDPDENYPQYSNKIEISSFTNDHNGEGNTYGQDVGEEEMDFISVSNTMTSNQAIFAIRKCGRVYANNINASPVSVTGYTGNSYIGRSDSPFTYGYFTHLNSVNTPTVSSDKSKKKSIYNLSDNYDNLFDSLQPKRFKWKNKSWGENQMLGFIANDIKESLDSLGINDQSIILGDEGEYSFSSTQIIPLNTWQIQKLKKRVSDLEDKIAKLEEK